MLFNEKVGLIVLWWIGLYGLYLNSIINPFREICVYFLLILSDKSFINEVF